MQWVMLALIVLYVCYIVVMRFKETREEQGGELTTKQWVVVAPFLVVGGVLDVVINVTVASLYFWEPPPCWLWDDPSSWTLSDRLDLYLLLPTYRNSTYWLDRWRVWNAKQLKPWLNKHDPGHIGRI